MAQPSNVEYIDAPNTLVQRAARPGGMTADAMVAAGEAAITARAGEYRKVRCRDLDELRALHANFLKTGEARILQEMGRAAYDLKGQGGTFGYSIVTAVADSLCTLIALLEKRADISAKAREALDAHIRALALLIEQDITGDGGKLGAELVTELHNLVGRIADM